MAGSSPLPPRPPSRFTDEPFQPGPSRREADRERDREPERYPTDRSWSDYRRDRPLRDDGYDNEPVSRSHGRHGRGRSRSGDREWARDGRGYERATYSERHGDGDRERDRHRERAEYRARDAADRQGGPGTPSRPGLAATSDRTGGGDAGRMSASAIPSKPGSPEEGQITSPLPRSAASLPRRPRSPSPLARRTYRSPSPPAPVRRERSRDRRSPPPYRHGHGHGRSRSPPPRHTHTYRRDPSFDRDRARDRERSRERVRDRDSRDYDRGPRSFAPAQRFDHSARASSSSRSPFSPPPRSYRRSRSPSTRSTGSSRYLSPEKRPASPRRRDSPEKRPRYVSPDRARDRSREREVGRLPMPADSRASSALASGSAAPAPQPTVQAPWVARAQAQAARLAPSGPRSDRIPTGPRALSGGAPPPTLPVPAGPSSNPYARSTTTSVSPADPVKPSSAAAPSPLERNYPHASTVPDSPASARPAWAPIATPQPGPVSPATNLSTPTAERPVNPYAASLSVAAGAPANSSAGPLQATPNIHRPSTPALAASQGTDQSQMPTTTTTTPVKTIPEEVMPVKRELTEVELAEQRARLEEARVMAEIPPLRISYRPAQWETDLENHYKHMAHLQSQTHRAQSAARIARAVLSDAEAEMLAAAERRKVCEDQLKMASSMIGLAGV